MFLLCQNKRTFFMRVKGGESCESDTGKIKGAGRQCQV